MSDVVYFVNLLVPKTRSVIESPHNWGPHLSLSSSSGGTARSTSLDPGSPRIMMYGTRSPYWGSAIGSKAIFFAATVAPGGGGTLSLKGC